MNQLAWAWWAYLWSLKLGKDASQPRACLCSYFSICNMGIIISVFRCFEFHVWKMIPDGNAKLFSLQHESSLGFLILWQFESCECRGWLQSGDPRSGPALPSDVWPEARGLSSWDPSLFICEMMELDQVICQLNIWLMQFKEMPSPKPVLPA